MLQVEMYYARANVSIFPAHVTTMLWYVKPCARNINIAAKKCYSQCKPKPVTPNIGTKQTVDHGWKKDALSPVHNGYLNYRCTHFVSLNFFLNELTFN